MTGSISEIAVRHIPEDELHAYLDQALSRSQCVEIECHLAECRSCRAERDRVAAVRDRTTALLASAVPRPLAIAPPFEQLVASHRVRASARVISLARVRSFGLLAAGLVAAVGAGWWGRGTVGMGGSARVPTAIAGQEVLAPERTLVAIGPVTPADSATGTPMAGVPSRARMALASSRARAESPLVAVADRAPETMVQVSTLTDQDGVPLDGLGALWLAVPLVHRGVLTGLVLSGPPRAPFDLEQEVFDLLRIVAQEVATYIAEQRATQTLLQTRQLHDYSKRFAFVAHDIKNVSSQLALLLSNAESHIANPAFQKDMLDTVRASVGKITALLRRLEAPEPDAAPGALAPLPRLESLVATYRRVRRSQIVLEHDGSTGNVAMGADAFETAVTHLLNNAVEATASSGAPMPGVVVVRVRHEARQVVIEIVDQGPGMTAAFVQDRLFKPFSTSKAGGSGIGAYQSRELLREAGGDLDVITAPGAGTTMRLLLPRTDQRMDQDPGDRAAARLLSGAEA